jgi:hypothetical protein
METLKNKKIATHRILWYILSVLVSCSQQKNSSPILKNESLVMNHEMVDTSFLNISNFQVEGFEYCDFKNLTKFKRIKPKVFYSKVDSVTDEILDGNDIVHLSQPRRFGYEDLGRKAKLNNEKLFIKRLIVNQDEYNDWYSFTNVLIDYQSSDDFYSNKRFLLMKNQPSGLSGRGNFINFIQLIDKDNKICYEFFLNDELCLRL